MALTIPVYVTAMVLPMIGFMQPLLATMVLGFPLDELIKWAFTTPVQFVIGARFHMGAYKALRGGRYPLTLEPRPASLSCSQAMLICKSPEQNSHSTVKKEFWLDLTQDLGTIRTPKGSHSVT